MKNIRRRASGTDTTAWAATAVCLALGGCGVLGSCPSPPTMPAGTESAEPDEDYDAALARLRTDPCTGLFWQIGTCDALLFIAESTGRSSVISYYDPQTGLRVGRTRSDDTGAPPPETPSIDCDERLVTETVLCSG